MRCANQLAPLTVVNDFVQFLISSSVLLAPTQNLGNLLSALYGICIMVNQFRQHHSKYCARKTLFKSLFSSYRLILFV